jgi:hypothetical protein
MKVKPLVVGCGVLLVKIMTLRSDISRGAFAAMILAIAFSGDLVPAQNDRTGALYANPFELKLEGTTKRRFREYYRQRQGEDFVTESFYPIGWSKDGKFAYYVEPVDEACGCYFARLFILDLKADKVLWEFNYDSEDLEEAKKARKPYSLNTLWQVNRKLFSDKLRENGIVPQVRFNLLEFPINHRGDLLTAHLQTKEKEGADADARFNGAINKVTLQMSSKRNGKKTILDHPYSEALPLYVGVAGYVKSHFEPRIAVILVQIHRGYEGPPHVGEVKIVGASLETGFK